MIPPPTVAGQMKNWGLSQSLPPDAAAAAATVAS
jgi:hypothetical protein